MEIKKNILLEWNKPEEPFAKVSLAYVKIWFQTLDIFVHHSFWEIYLWYFLYINSASHNLLDVLPL